MSLYPKPVTKPIIDDIKYNFNNLNIIRWLKIFSPGTKSNTRNAPGINCMRVSCWTLFACMKNVEMIRSSVLCVEMENINHIPLILSNFTLNNSRKIMNSILVISIKSFNASSTIDPNSFINLSKPWRKWLNNSKNFSKKSWKNLTPSIDKFSNKYFPLYSAKTQIKIPFILYLLIHLKRRVNLILNLRLSAQKINQNPHQLSRTGENHNSCFKGNYPI